MRRWTNSRRTSSCCQRTRGASERAQSIACGLKQRILQEAEVARQIYTHHSQLFVATRLHFHPPPVKSKLSPAISLAEAQR